MYHPYFANLSKVISENWTGIYYTDNQLVQFDVTLWVTEELAKSSSKGSAIETGSKVIKSRLAERWAVNKFNK